jgi:succinate dehydrogenase / fumarate reductase membrane anchor subunit
MFASSNLRSALGRARGLGSAKEGMHHWWAQRLTALALIPLTVWFVMSLIGLIGAGYQEFVQWLENPVNATAMILFLAVAFHHAQLGVRVVLEDYVGSHALRTTGVIVTKFLCFGLAAFSIVSTLIVAFGV